MDRRTIAVLAGLTFISIYARAQSTTPVTTTSGGTAGSIPVFTTGSNVENSVITQSNGNVGIGTTNANSALQVNGAINQTTLNQSILINTPGNVQYYHVATLPTSSALTYDHIRLQVVLDDAWASGAKSFLDVYFANRVSFAYSYNRWGSAGNGNIRLVAYNNSGQVDE